MTVQEFLPAGYGQLRVRWQAIGAPRECIVTFGYHPDTPSGDATDDSINFDSYLTGSGAPALAANFSTQWIYKGTYCTFMTESGPLVGQTDRSTVGTGTPTPMALNSALLLKKSTALGGRRGRGRCFLPPINLAESLIDSLGAVPPASATLVGNQWLAFRTAAIAGAYNLCLIHSYDPDKGETGIVPTPITNLVVDGKIATQRRRLR